MPDHQPIPCLGDRRHCTGQCLACSIPKATTTRRRGDRCRLGKGRQSAPVLLHIILTLPFLPFQDLLSLGSVSCNFLPFYTSLLVQKAISPAPPFLSFLNMFFFNDSRPWRRIVCSNSLVSSLKNGSPWQSVPPTSRTLHCPRQSFANPTTVTSTRVSVSSW